MYKKRDKNLIISTLFSVLFFLVLIFPSTSFAAMEVSENQLESITELRVFDTPNDKGKSLTLGWKVSKTEKA